MASLSHQYSLCHIPNIKWYWLVNHRRQFSTLARGGQENYGFEFVPFYEEGKYDIALLHLDQQCLEDGLYSLGKGSLFKELNSIIKDIPKIVLMHGTPFYPEMFPSDITKENYLELGYTQAQIGMSSTLIERFKEVVKDCDYVLFNSFRAKEQWGFDNVENSRTIWHGLDQKDWLDLPKEPRVITTITAGGLDDYYDRDFLNEVKTGLRDRNIELCHVMSDVNFDNFEQYREFIGRSLIYFNPTKQSPMPRSRTEAMLSGCCIITTLSQDADLFIKDGINGFRAIRNVKYICDLIELLINDYKKACSIGQEGKKTAQEIFSKERFDRQWWEMIDYVLTHKK